ncbi:PPE domain-containing protein [Actinophytocola sp. KF-1]
MAGDYGLSDLRFVGYDNQRLIEQVEGLRNGAGAGTLNDAVSALMELADGLAETDQTLRDQLKKVGVTWQGQAADGATSATESASIYADQAQGPVTDSAKGVDSQGAAFTTSKHSAPDAGALSGPTEESTVDQIAGFFGHTTDHAQQVKQTNAARDAAVDAMTGYQNNSSDALGQAQTLPVPPGMNLVAQPVDTGTSVSSAGSYTPTGSGYSPTGVGPGGSGPGTSFAPGTGGSNPIPTVPTPGGGGPNPPLGGPPITGGGPTPNNPFLPSTANPLGPAALRGANPMLMAEAATLMGAGGAGGAGAGAEGERLSRNAANRGPLKNGVPIGSVPEEEARAARNAERFGARTGRPGGSIMQPAAAGAGRNAEGEEDQEHVRRYGVESSDVFDDDRVVAPESIGDDDDR